MLTATLCASLSGNTVVGKGVGRGDDGVIWAGEKTNRADHDF